MIVRIWAATWRVRLVTDQQTRDSSHRPLVYTFWHGMQMPLVAVRAGRPVVVMVSWSRDGQLQAGVMRALGLSVVRGSTSRGAAAALRQIVRVLRTGAAAAFAVDGPRGPRYQVQGGAACAARLAGVRLVPVGAAPKRATPLPFARVLVWMGAPGARDPRVLQQAIWVACDQARVQLSGAGAASAAADRSRQYAGEAGASSTDQSDASAGND